MRGRRVDQKQPINSGGDGKALQFGGDQAKGKRCRYSRVERIMSLERLKGLMGRNTPGTDLGDLIKIENRGRRVALRT